MKRNLFYLTIIAFIILLFTNYSIVLDSTISAVNIWLYKVFPYLFMMITVNDLLINADFGYIFKNNILYVFIMSLISGTPTSAYIITSLYKEEKISKNNANYSLLFTYFCNPLFLYTILKLIFFQNSVVIRLMIIHYLSNIIIFFLIHRRLKKEVVDAKKAVINLSSSIKKGITTAIMILGAITFYMVVSDILNNTLNLSLLPKLLLKGTLEITQGLNSLITLDINFKIKEIIAIAIISFGGLSIHTQIKCILEETDLKYKYFLYGRFLGLLIGIFLTVITQAF